MVHEAYIIIDDRERVPTAHFKAFVNEYNEKYAKQSKSIKILKGRITTGDYTILLGNPKDENIIMVIERKTWKDLASSIRGERMNEQIQHMLEMRQKKKCILLYLIEDRAALPAKRTKFAKVPFSNLHAKLRHMLIRDNIPFIQTRNHMHSAETIVDLAADIIQLSLKGDLPMQKTGGEEEIPEASTSADSAASAESTERENNVEVEELVSIPDILTEVHVRKDCDIILRLWMSIPNVSEKSAPILSEKYKLKDIICGTVVEAELADIQYPSGTRIGTKRARSIMRLSKSGKCKKPSIAILSNIPGVTKKTAEKIINLHSLREICEGDVSEHELAQVEKSSNRRLGPKCAAKIVKFLTC